MARRYDPPLTEPGTRARARIVVECRRSIAGRRALDAVAELARERGARITVVATIPPSNEPARYCGSLGSSVWSDLMQSEARDELEEAADLLHDCPDVEFVLAPGARVPALVETAQRVEADAIIVAGRPPRVLQRSAPCAVLRAGQPPVRRRKARMLRRVT